MELNQILIDLWCIAMVVKIIQILAFTLDNVDLTANTNLFEGYQFRQDFIIIS